MISILGDGSYIFSNPVAVHHASTMHKLPVLTVVINNAMWGAVRRATLGMYPDGEAAKSNKPPFIDLDDLPAFETVCDAAGGYGERVEDPKELARGTETRARSGRWRPAGAHQRHLARRRGRLNAPAIGAARKRTGSRRM